MKMKTLGKTNIRVSEICFGTLTVGPLQRALSIQDGLRVMQEAVEHGINFFDTADLYNTYDYLRELLKIKNDAVICTKSYDYSAEGVRKSLERALRELDRDYVDIYMLHEQESRYTFEGHSEAIEELMRAKEAGKIRAFGISTHRVEAVRDALDFPEIEVVFPLVNPTGVGIEDGTAADMRKAAASLKAAGRGVFGMKPLGGGTLIREKKRCFAYARKMLDTGVLDAVAIGMQSPEEVRYNCRALLGESVPEELERSVGAMPRELHIDDWCEGCGSCVKKCSQKALSLKNGKASVDREKCLACGYCAAVCPVFCLKII
ncbi:MAG: aldo/keto reductase [Eubacteriaceae bacterium]|jgi:predicted aldo/keto reductase-like oxidoreductase